MNVLRIRAAWILAGAAWSLVAGMPALADDTELFVGRSVGSAAQPNILFILDTSTSMRAEVRTQIGYDPATSYSGACDTARIYWRTGTGDPPDCSRTDDWFYATALKCNAAMLALDAVAGSYTDRMAQYDAVDNGRRDTAERWERISSREKSQPVECEDDSGLHGDGTDPAKVYAQSGDVNAYWSSDSRDEVAWGQSPVDNTYTVYAANYLNWYNGPTSVSTRIEVVKDVAKNLVNTINGVNIGLMRFNDTEGGPVIHAVEDVATARANLTAAIDGLTADGWTPLSETLYEAGQYFRGANVDYGDRQGPPNSVDAARTAPGSNTYRSPVENTCQKNFIVLLTDGEPTQDVGANDKIEALPDFDTIVGAQCDGSATADGVCLDDMADYLFNGDVSDLGGSQNVATFTIGFTVDLPILKSTATRGGGKYFTADDTASLSTALTNIVTSVLETRTTFLAPGIGVNSFNRTQNLNDLYMAVFEPTGDVHWPGNLKKYLLDPASARIMDADGDPAVDPTTGFFATSARSFWSASPDGAEVAEGGAASALPDPDGRNLYTYLGISDLTDVSNRVSTSNALLDASALGLGAPGDPTVEQVIEYARGADVKDTDGDGDTSEPRYELGDPLHAEPQMVIYGGTPASPDTDDAVVYFSTNDGYLHAIDPTDGSEKWAFIPPEFLEDLVLLYDNEAVSEKHYGIDGSATIQYLRKNDDGVIDPDAGERVYLYFGMRRGGTVYYGLDVSDPDAPRLMWQLDSGDLPGVGQTWAKPVATRIAVGDGDRQNEDRLVLVIGGGYDPTQDDLAGGTDTSGNAIYIVDSVSGELLWHAAPSGADRNLPMMQYSIPADIKVVDMNSDRYADRMYVADMGGQIWRFDIFNGQSPASLVNGGVIAQLGGAPVEVPDATDSRRFFYSPDVAVVNDGEATFVNIGIGSGHRAHPNSNSAQDEFYALRDYLPFGTQTQAEYDAFATYPLTDADLIDITDDMNIDIPPGSHGWRLELRQGGWLGEKVLAQARTFDSKIFFTSFSPAGAGNDEGCAPKLGTNRLYIVDLLTGKPVTNLDGSVDDELTENDRSAEFNGSIASEVAFLFPSPTDEDCTGEDCAPPPVACVGLLCFNPDFRNDPVKTIWSEESVY